MLIKVSQLSSTKMAGNEEGTTSLDTSDDTKQNRLMQQPDYCNEQVIHRNRLPARAYFLPETSVLLNGLWKFNYAPTPLKAPEASEAGINAAEWNDIEVPGHWQLQGYGIPHYTNVRTFPVRRGRN